MKVKEIHFLEGYYATSKGDILDSENNKLHKYVKDKYNWVFIKGTEYKVSTLILGSFLPIPKYIKGTPIVNHFNLDKFDDRLENLDWVDRKWNAVHFHLMTATETSNHSYISLTKGKEEHKFSNLSTAAIFLKVNVKQLWEKVKSNGKLEGYRITYHSRVTKTNSGKEHNESLARDKSKYGESFTSASRPIKIMDLKKSEIVEYRNMLTAAKAFDVKLTHIRNRLSTPDKPKIFNKRYIIIDADKDFKWLTPVIIKELINRGTKKVIVFDDKTLTFNVYDSARSFIRKYSGYPNKKGYITKRLKRYDYCKYKQYAIAYLPEEEEHNPELFLILKMIGLK